MQRSVSIYSTDVIQQIQLEIWGRAQREAARGVH